MSAPDDPPPARLGEGDRGAQRLGGGAGQPLDGRDCPSTVAGATVPLPETSSGRISWLHVARSDGPLILTFPHGGTALPAPFDAGLVSRALAVRDCDWHIRDLYDGLADATRVWSDVSRTVIDLNRDPAGVSLYPGQATTELCPTTTFDGEPLYLADATIDVAARKAAYFDGYHAAIAAEIARLRGRHERVVVFDCHSIRSVVPRLFAGELPELNIGTNDGATCDPRLSDAVVEAVGDERSVVVNGRFKGGWTTRHYGRPDRGVHAIQLEIAQRAYLDEAAPDVWRADIAATLRPILSRILQACQDFAR